MEWKRKVATGLDLVYWGVGIQIVAAIVYFAARQIGKGGGFGSDPAEAVNVIFSATMLIGVAFGLVGKFLCLATPSDLAAVPLLYSALVFDVASIAMQVLAPFMDFLTTVYFLLGGPAAGLVAILCFIMYQRGIGSHFRDRGVTGTATTTFVLVVVTVLGFAAAFVSIFSGLKILFLVGLGGLVGLVGLVFYLVLLRKSAGSCSAPESAPRRTATSTTTPRPGGGTRMMRMTTTGRAGGGNATTIERRVPPEPRASAGGQAGPPADARGSGGMPPGKLVWRRHGNPSKIVFGANGSEARAGRNGMNGHINAALRGTGSSVPRRVVPNDWFVGKIDTSDEWIRTRTGIRERRFAGPEDTSASLGLQAARAALDRAGLRPDELDLIICATVTPDTMCPANACPIQAGLGCRPIPSFDLSAACTGFLYAMSVADQFIRARTVRNVLVVGTDVLSRTLDLTDRNSCILFGDGAGAAVLSASERVGFGIRSVRLYADGTPGHLIEVPGKVTLPPPDGALPRDHIRLNGREVFKFAVRRMVELIHDALAQCRVMGVEVDYLIPHQVNQRIIDSALETTGFPAGKVMVNLDRYGNTSAASVPIALDEGLREGRFGPGQTILLVAFGGGLTWGSTLITL